MNTTAVLFPDLSARIVPHEEGSARLRALREEIEARFSERQIERKAGEAVKEG